MLVIAALSGARDGVGGSAHRRIGDKPPRTPKSPLDAITVRWHGIPNVGEMRQPEVVLAGGLLRIRPGRTRRRSSDPDTHGIPLSPTRVGPVRAAGFTLASRDGKNHRMTRFILLLALAFTATASIRATQTCAFLPRGSFSAGCHAD